jgi:hypothetical protein
VATFTALDNVQVTESFADNRSLGVRLSAGGVILLVSYTTGTESALEVRVETSSDVAPPATWYLPTTSQGVDLSVALSVSATGNYRVSLPFVTDGNELVGPLGTGESLLRVSVRGVGAGSTGGSVSVKVLSTSAFPTTASSSDQFVSPDSPDSA